MTAIWKEIKGKRSYVFESLLSNSVEKNVTARSVDFRQKLGRPFSVESASPTGKPQDITVVVRVGFLMGLALSMEPSI